MTRAAADGHFTPAPSPTLATILPPPTSSRSPRARTRSDRGAGGASCGVPNVAFDRQRGHSGAVRQRRAGHVARHTDSMITWRGCGACWTMERSAAAPTLVAMAAKRFDFRVYGRAPAPRGACFAHGQRRRAELPVRAISARAAQWIFAQTYPVQEILFLDDASKDDSVEDAARRRRRGGK